jgi:hypothetical protein
VFFNSRGLTASNLRQAIGLEHYEDEQRNQKPGRRRSPATRLLAALVPPGLHVASDCSRTSLNAIALNQDISSQLQVDTLVS